MAKKTKKNIAKKKKKQNKVKAVVEETPVVELSDKELKAQEKEEEKKKKLADKEYQQKMKAKEKEEHPGFFKRCSNYVDSTFKELKKVQWLDNEQLMKASGAVAAIVAVFTGATWVADSVLGFISSLLLGI